MSSCCNEVWRVVSDLRYQVLRLYAEKVPGDLRDTVEKLQQDNERLRGLLRHAEWDSQGICLHCDRFRGAELGHAGHRDNCPIRDIVSEMKK